MEIDGYLPVFNSGLYVHRGNVNQESSFPFTFDVSHFTSPYSYGDSAGLTPASLLIPLMREPITAANVRIYIAFSISEEIKVKSRSN